MRTRLYSLDELDDIPGTTVFNALRSRQAYHLHKFCMSLMQPDNREAFRAGERAYLDRFRMSDEQKQAVLERDFTKLIDLGGNIYFLVKLSNTGFQYSSWSRPWSNAAPIAGTWLVAMPAVMRAPTSCPGSSAGPRASAPRRASSRRIRRGSSWSSS